MRRIKLGKYGLLEDPRHFIVCLKLGDRELLGEVIGVRRDPSTGALLLRVKHFCGESWPIEPAVGAVSVVSES